MTIEITMLNVGDADAIIIHLQRSEKDQLVILIDGGHSGDGAKCIEKLDPILKKANKPAPDLIICTHYDADHIAGLIKVVKKYGNGIKQVWMHQPGVLKNLTDVSAIKLNSFNTEAAHPHIKKFNEFVESEAGKAEKLVLESYNQMRDLIAAIESFKEIKLVEPFPKTKYEKWPEIQVLGPSEEFYKQCVAKMKDVPTVINEEAEAIVNYKNNSVLLFEQFTKENLSPCEQLTKQKKDKVTMVNQISVILQIMVEGNKYLFTGDASLESFNAIPNRDEALKDVYWLKVPHHGSHNNSSPELFDIMKPKFADISGGDRYLDDIVRDCLIAKKAEVRTTRDAKSDLTFPYTTI